MKKKTEKKNSKFADSDILQLLDNKDRKGYSLPALVNLLPKKFTVDKIEQSLDFLCKQEKIEEKEGIFYIAETPKEPKAPVKKRRESADGTYEGIVDIARSGAVFVLTPMGNKDIFISGRPINGILKGDTVLVKLMKPMKEGKRPEGKIIEVLHRAHNLFVGTIEITPSFSFVKTESEWLKNDIYIPPKATLKAKHGDRVIVKIIKWNEKDKNPTGEVIDVLGEMTANDQAMNSILIEGGFHLRFPEEVMKEADEIPDTISAQEIKNRLDYRGVTTFTIDPDDAKDFDDALSFKELENGNYEVGVHIADVAHYLQPDTALDKEAIQRGTSVYLPDRVCPMLPEKLSNVLCSLRPNEDKLSFSVLFEFDKQYKIQQYKFAKTVINSDRRFTYNEAQEVIENKVGDFVHEIGICAAIARKMRAERFEQGAIAFESKEVRFILDENAKPIDVYTKDRKEAHMMIEDWMLLANKTVAKYMSALKIHSAPVPFVYRIHDSPNEIKLETFRTVASRFGHNLQRFKNMKDVAPILNAFLESVQGKPEQNILEQLAIRSMAKAIYTTENIGHYGLGFEYYTHFTSPIRRYPDVLVHRLLYSQMLHQAPPFLKEDLEEICKKNSEMERAASDCERASIKYKQVEYLEDKKGQTFDGIISGMIQKGFWVELLHSKCEGFVDIQTVLPDDTIYYDEERMELSALKSKMIFKIGEPVKIKVLDTDLKERKIWFEFIEKLMP